MTRARNRFPLPYLSEDVDRHGNARLYVRIKHRGKVRMTAAIDAPEFWDAYHKAVTALQAGEAPGKGARHKAAIPGSLRAIAQRYWQSAAFRALDPRTQRIRRAIIDRICAGHGGADGDKPARLLESRHIIAWRDRLAATPESANALIKALRQLYAFAVEAHLAERNPARDVAYLRSGSTGFHSWTDAEIAAFESCHPIGTRARLALALLLETGQRRGDVVALGPQHVKEGWLTLTQAKGRKRHPVTLSIPVTAQLAHIIAATPSGHLTFLVTEFGRPFTAAGFGNRFRKWCDEAGLPARCSAHGLRKAAAARLAEAGATERQIMAITGHRTSKEVTRYTAAASQKRLAAQAMCLLESGPKAEPGVPLLPGKSPGGTLSRPKSLKNKG